jgi:hypothetical protein
VLFIGVVYFIFPEKVQKKAHLGMGRARHTSVLKNNVFKNFLYKELIIRFLTFFTLENEKSQKPLFSLHKKVGKKGVQIQFLTH